jgi:hypothetical protein
MVRTSFFKNYLRSTKIGSVSALLLGISLFGCGDDKKKDDSTTGPNPSVSSNNKRSMAVVNAAALPNCDSGAEGWLVYLKAEQKFQVCSNNSWSEINISGPAGPVGPAGPAGPTGTSEDKISATIFCTGSLQNTALYFDYYAAQMSNGDVFVNGAIRGVAYQVAGSTYFSSKQNGYNNARILIAYDVLGAANAGFFELFLDRKTLIVTVKYNDSDGDLSWIMTPDKCISTTL